MVFEASCICLQHSTWYHGDSLRNAISDELQYCGMDMPKNRTRKRKISALCCKRISLELKSRRYEVSLCLQDHMTCDNFVDRTVPVIILLSRDAMVTQQNLGTIAGKRFTFSQRKCLTCGRRECLASC